MRSKQASEAMRLSFLSQGAKVTAELTRFFDVRNAGFRHPHGVSFFQGGQGVFMLVQIFHTLEKGRKRDREVGKKRSGRPNRRRRAHMYAGGLLSVY